MISIIVDRFHVGTPNREVLREFFRRPQFKALARADRKTFYRLALERHEDNRRVYRWTMTGR
jgi:hypothetical protein